MTVFDTAWLVVKDPIGPARYPIENRDDADAYLTWLEGSPFKYHYDDDPTEGMQTGKNSYWPDGLAELLGKRHQEMWQHINPWEWLEMWSGDE
tara:strand:- start:1029 stop:1307 length:279 start_codon:yes stop_codon:yes gene_type:complete